MPTRDEYMMDTLLERDAERKRQQIDRGELPDPFRHVDQRVNQPCPDCGTMIKVWPDRTGMRKIYNIQIRCKDCKEKTMAVNPLCGICSQEKRHFCLECDVNTLKAERSALYRALQTAGIDPDKILNIYWEEQKRAKEESVAQPEPAPAPTPASEPDDPSLKREVPLTDPETEEEIEDSTEARQTAAALLSKKTKKQLQKIASDAGIQVKTVWKKADLINAILDNN